ncbi:PH domain-containing protein [Mycetocola tolaasinivorans]|uniref:PH domain-containing protein n=1 Tax=Mycetocola tolaasinivorans TaxID=76635 RepID=UPI001FE51762|nr:PH domain-containing protein [Mycetocola tolaasinivorans]
MPSATDPATAEHTHPAAAPAAPDDRGALELDYPLGQWQRISPKYAVIEQIGNGVTMLIVAVIAALVWWLNETPWPLIAGGAVLIILIITAILIPRRARSIGYLLREDDLLFRRGIMWQRFVAVPYGRMQLVDINRGPVARAFGLSELKFVTAAVGTNVVIPGLPLEEAERLRDHLVAVAESRRSGL